MAANLAAETSLDLSWLNLYDDAASAVPGKKGLTLKEINLGRYADAARGGGDMTYRIRGAVARPGAQRFGPNYMSKSDVWSENCIMLYEEATQRQWSSARDIPWDTLEDLPDEMERAMCQLCTMLTEVEFIAGDVPGQWMPFVSAQDFEAGLFLMSQIMDEARHTDVFRKRALANGGSLGQQGLGTLYRSWFGALKLTELFVAINVVYKSYEVATFEKLAELAPLAVDRDIFGRLANDSRRHLEFGIRNLKYYVQHHPNAREYLSHFLNRSEASLADELMYSPTEGASLAIIFGGGVENLAVGAEKLRNHREDQLRKYLLLLDSVAVDRLPTVNLGLLGLARSAQPA